jgi:hypothetical protein
MQSKITWRLVNNGLKNVEGINRSLIQGDIMAAACSDWGKAREME